MTGFDTFNEIQAHLPGAAEILLDEVAKITRVAAQTTHVLEVGNGVGRADMPVRAPIDRVVEAPSVQPPSADVPSTIGGELNLETIRQTIEQIHGAQ